MPWDISGDINSLQVCFDITSNAFSSHPGFFPVVSQIVSSQAGGHAGRGNFVHSKIWKTDEEDSCSNIIQPRHLYHISSFIITIIPGNITHLSCPQRIGSVVQGLTTGGKCYHCNPHDRSCWLWPPPPPSHSELWGTDLGYLWDYETEFEVMAMT